MHGEPTTGLRELPPVQGTARLIAATLIACALLFFSALMAPALAQGAAPGGYPSQPGQTGPASYGGGYIQANPRIVLVFWGWTGTAPEQATLVAERAMFDRLAGSAYGGILAQYGVHDDAKLAAIVTDPQAPPGKRLGIGDMQAEVLRARRLLGLANTRDTQWTVFPPADADLDGFQGACGEHGSFWRDKRRYTWAFTMPYYAPAWSGCVQHGPWLRAQTAATSHEYAEAATDTHDGWVLPLGPGYVQEIADICAGQYVQPWGQSGPTVQALWSNASEGPNGDRGCVQSAGGGVPR